MTREDILQRSDCANCGAEATYEPILNSNDFILDCCNIDCRYSNPAVVTIEQASQSASA